MRNKKKDKAMGLVKGFFSYSTVKEAKTYNLKISLIYRLLQFVIVFYVIG
jgi:hypothetical protein